MRHAAIVIVLLTTACTVGPEESGGECVAANHCLSVDGEAECEAGYVWEDASDKNNLACIEDPGPVMMRLADVTLCTNEGLANSPGGIPPSSYTLEVVAKNSGGAGTWRVRAARRWQDGFGAEIEDHTYGPFEAGALVDMTIDDSYGSPAGWWQQSLRLFVDSARSSGEPYEETDAIIMHSYQEGCDTLESARARE